MRQEVGERRNQMKRKRIKIGCVSNEENGRHFWELKETDGLLLKIM